MSDPYSPLSSDPANPYASPQVEMILPHGVQWVQADSPSLRQTGVGLSLIYYGIVTVLLSVIVMVMGVCAAAVAGGRFGRLALGVTALAGLGVIVGSILNFVGPLVCLAVPAESGAKGLIVGSVILQLGSVTHTVLLVVAPGVISGPMSTAMNLLGIVAALLFVLFMKQVSAYIGRPDLAARARNVLLAAAALFLTGVLGTVASLATAGPEGVRSLAMDGPGALPGLALLMMVLAIGVLIVFVMYANLIDALRKALQHPMGYGTKGGRERGDVA